MAAGGAGGGGKTYSFKVVLLGEGCVGKTSLVLRYCENKFNDKHITTLQVGVRRFSLRYRGFKAPFMKTLPLHTAVSRGGPAF